jgi:cardiolipin synthase A/B
MSISLLFLVFLAGFLSLLIMNLWSPYKRVKFKIETSYSVSDDEFRRSIVGLIGTEMVAGNRIRALQNGDEIFPAMFEAVAQAKRVICIESYIFWKGTVGTQFTDLLCEKAKQGVVVNMLIDWLGSKDFDPKLLRRLEESKVNVYFYHPPRWYTLSRLNNRTHRKIMVIDGQIGFIGGVGIADEWRGNGLQAKRWRDTHYCVLGPVVGQFQSAFSDNWIMSQEEVPHGDMYFPSLERFSEAPAGDFLVTAQMFKSSSDEGASSLRLLFLYSIAGAKRTIDIASPYFVPDTYTVEQLIKASQCGVRVRIMVPGSKIDSRVTRKASRAIWGELLQAGCEIYEYLPSMLHAKLMVVDEIWTCIGSANFDARSFRINDEANLNVLDKRFAKEQTRIFNVDIERSRQMTYKKWMKRPFYKRASDYVFLAIRSQL